MTEAEQTAITGHSLVLYDGVCGLCNHVVQLLLRLDREDQFRFAPLESALAVEFLARFPVPSNEPEGVILVTDVLSPQEALYRRFDAVAEAMRRLQGPFRPLGALLRLIPRPLREWSYSLIARHRYQIFGRFDTCPIPTPAQRSRILGL